MPSIGKVECFYHPDKMNASWCVKCGKPVCHQCDKHSFLAQSGYSTCPPCKSRYVNIFTITGISIFSGLLVFMMLISITSSLMAAIIFLAILDVVFIVILVLNIRGYNEWITTVDEYLITSQPYSISVHKHDLIPCAFHPDAPSIGRCDECESEVCVDCSRVKNRSRYSPAQFLCKGHYWGKMGKTFLILAIIMLVIGTLPTILVVIFTSPSGPYSPVPIMFYALTLPFSILAGIFYLIYLKYKWDYVRWNEEVGFDLK